MNFSLPRLFSSSFFLTLAVAAMFAPATVIAFTILAKLDRDGNGAAGPSDNACTFCVNTATSVRTHFSGNFPPSNSEISGRAVMDLVSGGMTGRAHAVAIGNGAQHSMMFTSRMEESITVTLPPGLPTAERIITVASSVTGGGAATGSATAGVNFSLQVSNVTGSLSRNSPGEWVLNGAANPNVVSNPIPSGGSLRVTSVIPSSRVVQITAQLQGTAFALGTVTGSGMADVNGLAGLLWISLPPGAIYTSTSGVFLTGSKSDAWRLQHFDATENSGPGADDADPDGDGIVNLMEFATLTNPLIATPLPIEPVLAGGDVEFSYTRNKAALGEVAYVVEWSDTPGAGIWSTAGITEIILSEDDVSQRIKAIVPAEAQRRFVRLSVAGAGP